MNKKIVFIVVLVECILAVLLISFFGQAIFMAINKSVVTEVYFTYENGEKIEDEVDLEVEISDTSLSHQLYWAVIPDTATNKTVSFTSNKKGVIVDANGLVSFLDEATTNVIITIHSEDGSNKTDSILLVVKNDGAGGEVDGI